MNLNRALMLCAIIGLLLVVGCTILFVESAAAHNGCHSAACSERVEKRAAHAKWRAAVRAYGVGLLRARMRCESASYGGYALSTNGNGYWFGHQFDVAAWTGAGGRMRRGRPAGVWSMQPSRLEQDARAVRWDAIHGGDPWPNCP